MRISREIITIDERFFTCQIFIASWIRSSFCLEMERVLSPLRGKLIGETHERKGARKKRIRKEKMEGEILERLERKKK